VKRVSRWSKEKKYSWATKTRGDMGGKFVARGNYSREGFSVKEKGAGG